MAPSEFSVLEKLQQVSDSAEVWWDSLPLDFPRWRDTMLDRAPDASTHRRWSAQLNRFLQPDDPSRSLIRGVTTNPSLIAKSIMAVPELWSGEIHQQVAQYRSSDAEAVFWHVYQEAARRAAEAMLPLWLSTDGRYGWVSVQLDPRYVFDAEAMLEQAMQLASLAANVMVKVPGTMAGYTVIQQLVCRGISINNTLTYTVPQFLECIRAVESGLEAARRTGTPTDRWRAVVTHMIGRYGADGDLLAEAAQRQISLSWSDVRWAEIAVLKIIQGIIDIGRHPVKMLLSSLEVDDRAAGATSLSMHLERTAGADIVYTCKPNFVEALMRRESELQSLDQAAFDLPVPANVLNRLMRLPYFRRAIEPDGMAPQEFSSHGAFINTHAEVNYHVRRLIDFIAHRIEGITPPSSRPALGRCVTTAQTTAQEDVMYVDATEQYVPTLVDRWDELIHWSRRAEGEHGFFSDTLTEAGVRTVLDAAAGTGYHSVMLAEAGFEVTTVDVSAPMLRRAEQNGLAYGHALQTVQADWRELDRRIEARFDAIICLGSSFPHLFTEADRLATLRQFHARLNPGGLLIIDHRNFDAIRAHRYTSSGRYYYCGTGVRVSVEYVDDRRCRFRYDFPDDTHYLEVYPVLTEELGSLLEQTGFDRAATLGDFVKRPEPGTSDFVIHVSKKRGRGE